MKKIALYLFVFSVIVLIFSSCEEILLEDNITTNEMNLIAPVDNAMLTNTGVVFSWDIIKNATQYRLQIAKPDFINPLQIVLDTLVTSNSFNQQLNIGNYQWRVKAVNSAYETPYKTRNITIVSNSDFQSNSIVLLTPNNSLVTNSTTQTLSWQSIIGATGYQVQILDSNNTVIATQTITTTSLNYTFPEGAFQ